MNIYRLKMRTRRNGNRRIGDFRKKLHLIEGINTINFHKITHEFIRDSKSVLIIPLTAFMAYNYGLNNAWWAFVITEVICMLLSFVFLIKINKQVIVKM